MLSTICFAYAYSKKYPVTCKQDRSMILQPFFSATFDIYLNNPQAAIDHCPPVCSPAQGATLRTTPPAAVHDRLPLCE